MGNAVKDIESKVNDGVDGILGEGNIITTAQEVGNFGQNVSNAVANPLSFSTGGIFGGDSGVAQFDTGGFGVSDSSLTGWMSNKNVSVPVTAVAAMFGGEALYGMGGAGTGAASWFGGGGAGAGAGAGAASAGGGFFSSATPWLMGAGILGNLYTGQQSTDAMKEAAAKSEAASAAALDFQKSAFAQQLAMQEPYREAGAIGLEGAKRLASDPNAYQQSPYAHWLQQQGEKAGIAASQASGGLSGGALAALSQQAQGNAGAGYADQYNRFASLAGLGQTATSRAASDTGNYAANSGNIMMQNATTQGNVGMAVAGQQASTFNSILNTVAQGAGMYNNSSNNGGGAAPAVASTYDFSQPMDFSGNGTSTWNSSMPNQAPSNWYA